MKPFCFAHGHKVEKDDRLYQVVLLLPQHTFRRHPFVVLSTGDAAWHMP